MTTRSISVRPKALTIAAVALFGCAIIPGTAQAGFFENLFGGGAPEPQQAPSYAPDMPQDNGYLSAPREIHRPRRQVVQDEKPVLQKTTDIWHDKTLREGDAVMMKDGLHIYVGSHGDRPVARDLPRLDNVELPRKERTLLVSMDTTRDDPLTTGAPPDTIASGRSAAVASAVVAGYKITDARGKSVRYVGP